MTEKEVIELVARLLGEAGTAFEPAVLEAVRSNTSQISQESADDIFRLVGELVQMVNRAAGTDCRLINAHSTPPSNETKLGGDDAGSVKKDSYLKKPGDGPRKHDDVFDFIALDFIRHRESSERLASKQDMLAALQAYDPKATDTSLSPTLHKWKKDKGWINWPPRKLDRISLTDGGRAHLKAIHAYAAEKEDEVVTVMRKVIDPDYSFPRLT